MAPAFTPTGEHNTRVVRIWGRSGSTTRTNSGRTQSGQSTDLNPEPQNCEADVITNTPSQVSSKKRVCVCVIKRPLSKHPPVTGPGVAG